MLFDLGSSCKKGINGGKIGESIAALTISNFQSERVIIKIINYMLMNSMTTLA